MPFGAGSRCGGGGRGRCGGRRFGLRGFVHCVLLVLGMPLRRVRRGGGGEVLAVRFDERGDLLLVDARHEVFVRADRVAGRQERLCVGPRERLDIQECLGARRDGRQHRLQVDGQQAEGVEHDRADVVQLLGVVVLREFPGLVLVDELVHDVGERHHLAQRLAEFAGVVVRGDHPRGFAQAGQLGLIAGHDELAAVVVGDALLAGVGIHRRSPGDRHPGFEAARRVVEPGVHDPRVAPGLVLSEGRLLLDEHNLIPTPGQRPRRCQTDDAPTDNRNRAHPTEPMPGAACPRHPSQLAAQAPTPRRRRCPGRRGRARSGVAPGWPGRPPHRR